MTSRKRRDEGVEASLGQNLKSVSWVVLTAVVGGLTGGLAVWLSQGHSIHLRPEGMSYAELAAVLLGSVSVLVAIFGVLMAVLALWGYRHFRNVAKRASAEIARNVASKEVLKEMRDGVAGSVIDQKVLEAVDAMRNGKYDAWREARDAASQRLNELDRAEEEDGE
jgi:hypothetical protein